MKPTRHPSPLHLSSVPPRASPGPPQPQQPPPPRHCQHERAGLFREPEQAIQVSALGASENLFSVVEYRLPVLELLLTTAATALPCRSFLPLEWSRLDRLLRQPRHAQHTH